MNVTRESFLSDVASHRMAVRHASGGYRHLTFSRYNSNNQSFAIVTWPWHLCITGDMGTWVFDRDEDMFEFFRGTQIKPEYWEEKIEAEDRNGTREFSLDHFRAEAIRRVAGWYDGDREVAEALASLEEELEGAENQQQASIALMEWSHRGNCFDVSELPDGMVWTFRYLWACHAIQWAIKQYDKWRSA